MPIAVWIIASAVALLIGANAQADPPLRPETIQTWEEPMEWFGGLSGIEVLDGGATLVAITDRGYRLSADMIRDPTGRLMKVRIMAAEPIRYRNGLPVKGPFADAEGLAIAPDGTRYLSFERRHRIMAYAPGEGPISRLPPHPDFAQFSKNKGFEALALHPDGTLIAVPEGTMDPRADFAIYAFAKDHWQISGNIPRSGPFLPVGADIDAQGRLFLLERATSPLGFRSRIRWFAAPYGRAAFGTIIDTIPGQFDNLEAISIWTGPDGTSRLTLVSDDNFLAAQRTQIVEFVLNEGLALPSDRP